MRSAILFMLLILIALASGCVEPQVADEQRVETEIPSPAAQYCSQLGYKYEIRSKPAGQYGVCVFNGLECDAWEFFTGECGQEFSYCELSGGEITVSTEGCHFTSKCAVCIYPDKSCNEWDNFNGKC